MGMTFGFGVPNMFLLAHRNKRDPSEFGFRVEISPSGDVGGETSPTTEHSTHSRSGVLLKLATYVPPRLFAASNSKPVTSAVHEVSLRAMTIGETEVCRYPRSACSPRNSRIYVTRERIEILREPIEVTETPAGSEVSSTNMLSHPATASCFVSCSSIYFR